MVNYWQHRIKGGDYAEPLATPLLFKHQILSIGWSHINDASFLGALKGITAWPEFESKLFAVYQQKSTNRYSLWRYLHEMKKGDIVVVPTWREFSIYRLSDDNIMISEDLPNEILYDKWNRPIKKEDGYLIDADGNQVDLGYFRKVEPIIEHISRERLDNKLHKRMKAHQTTLNVSRLSTSVDKYLNL